MRFTAALFLALFLLSIPAYAGQLEDAYNRKDYQTALKLLLPSAEQGNAEAQYQVGYIYAEGQIFGGRGSSVKKDDAEAAKWYRKAAEQGEIDAVKVLGDIYYNGWGVERDYTEAAKWYLASAKHGDPDAAFKISELYDAGKGVRQDYVEAYFWGVLTDAGHWRFFQDAKEHLTPEQKAAVDKRVQDGISKGKIHMLDRVTYQ